MTQLRLRDGHLTEMKRKCEKCGRMYPSTEKFFVKSKTGLRHRCHDCHRSIGRGYYQANRDHIRALVSRYRKANWEAVSAAKRRCAAQVRLEVLQHYGGTPPSCACCGEARLQFLAIDHIYGRKNSPKELWPRGQTLQYRLRKRGFPTGFRILCHNCNFAIAYYGGCPYQSEEMA